MDDVHSRLLREVNTYLDFFQRRRVVPSFASSPPAACTDLAWTSHRQEIEQDYVDALRKVCRQGLAVLAVLADPVAIYSSR